MSEKLPLIGAQKLSTTALNLTRGQLPEMFVLGDPLGRRILCNPLDVIRRSLDEMDARQRTRNELIKKYIEARPELSWNEITALVENFMSTETGERPAN